jgi:hypothetical protein
MKTYGWRNNVTAFFLDQDKLIRGRLAFKTKQTSWINSKAPVVILISIDSAFHQPIEGDLKMNALITTVKNHVRDRVTILLTDQAHVHVLSLKYGNNREKAQREYIENAQQHVERYKAYFKGCNLEYWHSYIEKDKSFTENLKFVHDLFKINPLFRACLYKDAHASYTHQRTQEYPDQELFIKNAIEDILGQCACLLVLAHKGYRFQFYPGPSCESTEYINRIVIPPHQQVTWVNVFLSIEKKTVLYFDKNEITLD